MQQKSQRLKLGFLLLGRKYRDINTFNCNPTKNPETSCMCTDVFHKTFLSKSFEQIMMSSSLSLLKLQKIDSGKYINF